MVRNRETGKLEMFHEISFNHDWPARLQTLHRAARAAYESYSELEDLVPSEFTPPPAGTRHETVQLAASAWFQVSAISEAGCAALAEWIADPGGEEEEEITPERCGGGTGRVNAAFNVPF